MIYLCKGPSPEMFALILVALLLVVAIFCITPIWIAIKASRQTAISVNASIIILSLLMLAGCDTGFGFLFLMIPSLFGLGYSIFSREEE
jgi:hypothetical protein